VTSQADTAHSIFYGWWIVAGSFVILFIAVGAGLYAPPVFLVPLQQHFGWSRAAIAAGSAIAALVSGMVSPLVGAWNDTYGSRAVMTFGALVMGSAFLLLSTVTALWHLYTLNGLAAIGITCCAWIPIQTLIANWFDKQRGLAMGIALTGIGFGGMVMAPLAGVLITRFGWRLAFAGLGALILTSAAVVLAIVRSRPTDMGLLPDGAAAAAPDMRATPDAAGPDAGADLGQAVRSAAFWILAATHLLWTFASFSVLAHLVAHLRDVGFDGGIAAGALGLTVGASVVGRVVIGYWADSANKRVAMSLALAFSGLSTGLLLSIRLPGALPLFVVAYGIGLGGIAVLFPLLIGECFGLLAFGKILGLIMIAATMGGAAGPVLTGRIYDVTGSYRGAFALHVGVFIAAALAISFLPRQLTRAPAPPITPAPG
jgi:MFS family permease